MRCRTSTCRTASRGRASCSSTRSRTRTPAGIGAAAGLLIPHPRIESERTGRSDRCRGCSLRVAVAPNFATLRDAPSRIDRAPSSAPAVESIQNIRATGSNTSRRRARTPQGRSRQRTGRRPRSGRADRVQAVDRRVHLSAHDRVAGPFLQETPHGAIYGEQVAGNRPEGRILASDSPNARVGAGWRGTIQRAASLTALSRSR